MHRSCKCFICSWLFIHFISLFTYNRQRSIGSNCFRFRGKINSRSWKRFRFSWNMILLYISLVCYTTCFGYLNCNKIYPSLYWNSYRWTMGKQRCFYALFGLSSWFSSGYALYDIYNSDDENSYISFICYSTHVYCNEVNSV